MKIAICGPESCGKTTLCKLLADKYNFDYIPEYARIYLESKGSKYSYNDLITIAKHQYNLIRSRPSSNKVIIDTGLINIKIWSIFEFNKYEPILDEWIMNSEIVHYFLLYPDVEWKQDPLRTNKNNRKDIFKLFEQELNNINAAYTIITGDYSWRAKKVTLQLEQFLIDS